MPQVDEARRDNRIDDALDATAGTLLVLNKGPSPALKEAVMSIHCVPWIHAMVCPWTLCFNETGTLRDVGPPLQ